jgi:hypothetical protein
MSIAGYASPKELEQVKALNDKEKKQFKSHQAYGDKFIACLESVIQHDYTIAKRGG